MSPSHQEFGRAIEEAIADEASQERTVFTTVTISKRDIALYEPSAGSLAYMVTIAESYGEEDAVQLVGTLLTFIGDMMDPDDRRHVMRAIRTGALGNDDILDLFTAIVEGLAGRPTQSSTGSSPSRRTTGQRSTAASRRVASTPSATSRRTAS